MINKARENNQLNQASIHDKTLNKLRTERTFPTWLRVKIPMTNIIHNGEKPENLSSNIDYKTWMPALTTSFQQYIESCIYCNLIRKIKTSIKTGKGRLNF